MIINYNIKSGLKNQSATIRRSCVDFLPITYHLNLENSNKKSHHYIVISPYRRILQISEGLKTRRFKRNSKMFIIFTNGDSFNIQDI